MSSLFVFRGLLLSLLWVLAACSQSSTRKSDKGKLRIVATTTLAADAARQLLGPQAEIKMLMGPGTDPHLFKAALQDVKALFAADIIIAGGLHLEGKMQDLLEKAETGRTVIFIGEGVPKAQLRYPAAGAQVPDPHIWFDVTAWAQGVNYLAKNLAYALPGQAAMIAQRNAAYQDTLTKLDEWVQSQVDVIPLTSRVLVTSHDAFGYFGRRYKVEVKTLQGISTVAEFGLKDVSELVNFLIISKIPTIYPESSMPVQSLRAVQEGCARRGWPVRLGNPLYSDALDAPASPAGTYTGMIRYNVTTITYGLSAAPRP